jgi:CheY-like chemotaxis protein
LGFCQLIIGLTGNVLDDDVREYLQAGADMVLGKPLKIGMLQLLIQHIEQYGAASMQPYSVLRESSEGPLEWVPFNN